MTGSRIRRVPGVAHDFMDCTDYPSPTVVADRPTRVYLTDDGKPESVSITSKPPYRVPTMAQIAALPWNGLTVASTFSGGGGSCTGYRMAGYRVAYANEFVPAAQATYKANHPDSYLDPRDIRTVTPESVLEHLGMKPGELDLFDGSPPCSAFSTAGKRQAGWGKTKAYSDDKAQVVDDLFFEYARLLRGIQPKVFVAENVSGLVKGSAKGYFLAILAELKSCGYAVKAKLLDASWLGVPQARQRLIFIGVRNDLGLDPVFPAPLPYFYSVRDALPHATASIEGYGKNIKPNKPGNSFPRNRRQDASAPCGTVTAAASQINGSPSVLEVFEDGETKVRRIEIAEAKRICAFPDDYVLLGDYRQQWERLGRSVPPVMMASIATTVRDRILVLVQSAGLHVTAEAAT